MLNTLLYYFTRATLSERGVNKPIIVRSWRKHKKYAVKFPDGKYIHFGDKRYQDFTQHKNAARRARYIARAEKIRDKRGRLTINNPRTANYWAARVLWNY